MPSRCCVPRCSGNYPSGPRVTVFLFPKNENLKQRWINTIKRDNFTPSPTSVVCEKHFTDSDIETSTSAFDERSGKLITVPLGKKRLKKDAVPSIYPEYPPYLSTCSPTTVRVSPDSKRTHREHQNIERAIQNSLLESEAYNAAREVASFEDVLRCIELFGLPEIWSTKRLKGCLCIFAMTLEPVPSIPYSMCINEDLEITAYLGSAGLKQIGKESLPYKLSSFCKLTELLDNLASLQSHESHKTVVDTVNDLIGTLLAEGNANSVDFIKEQVTLLLYNKHALRYSCSLMIFASLVNTISPHAYKFIRSSGYLTLPHPTTIKSMCNSLDISPETEKLERDFLKYVRKRSSTVSDADKKVSLLIDEIHLKPYFDYKGGSVIGNAFDSNDAAHSAYVFMISSLLSPLKEVAHILPVKTMTHFTFFSIIKKVIEGLEEIGFFVMCVVSDNNAINRKAISHFGPENCETSFVYPHPSDNTRPLFYIPDSVHLLKNIRNNWINQKNEGKCFIYPSFEDESLHPQVASFHSLRQLHQIEANNLVKYSYGLSLKSLFPSTMERQNVSLVLKIFNRFVEVALLEQGPQNHIQHFDGTAKFIAIICTWWDICNVKNPSKGARLKNHYMAPLTNDLLDEKNVFLEKFILWLDKWRELHRRPSCGSLSKETHDALKAHVCGILEFTSYCSELGINYLLPGKIQTDALEERFGKYRQLAGSNYHISLQQLLECEKKLRLQSSITLELELKGKVRQLDIPLEEEHILEESCSDVLNVCAVNILCTQEDITRATKYLPVLTYIGGYCCYAVLKKLHCECCKALLTVDSQIILEDRFKLIKRMDRGGLLCPNEKVVNLVMYNYIIVDKLLSNHQNVFLSIANQRNFVIDCTLNALDHDEVMYDAIDCSTGHLFCEVSKMLLTASTNIMLKNMCTKKNDTLGKTGGKKRKLATLTH